MKTRHALASLAVLVAGALLLYAAGAWRNAPGLAPPETDPAAASRMTAAPDDAAPAEDSSRAAVAAPTPPPANPDAQAFRVVGRCLDPESDAPVAGCRVQARRELTTEDEREPWPSATPTADGTTAEDGTFDLQVPLDARHENAALCLSKPGFVPRTTRWTRPAAGSTIELGDVPMQRAIRVRGTVIHPDGAPAAGVGVLFANVALTDKAKAQPERMLRTRTDAGGNFLLEDAAFAGEWYPRVEGSGALVGPQMVVLNTDTGPDYTIEITVEKPDPEFTITGICVDEAGNPLAGVRVSGSGEGFTGQGWSNSDGLVAIPRAGPMPVRRGVSLSAYDASGSFEQILPEAGSRFRWGDRDVRIVLKRRARHDVHVVDTRGAPATEFSLFTFQVYDDRLTLYHRLSLHGHHPDGRVTLTRLRNGGNALVVAPDEPGLGSSGLVRFVADGTAPAAELQVTVPDLTTLDVRLTDLRGTGISGSRVELLMSLRAAPPTVETEAVDLEDCDRDRTTPAALRLTAETTDAEGRARLSAPPGDWFLRMTGEGHIDRVQPVRVATTGDVVHVTVDIGCTLQGEVAPRSALATLQELSAGNPLTVELRGPAHGDTTVAEVAADGSFAARGLKPGHYAVALRYWLDTSNVTEGWVTAPLTSVDLLPDQPYELAIDASRHLPGRVSGRILVDGSPLAGKHCFAKRREPEPSVMFRFGTDRDGRYSALIPPGTYAHSITLEAQPGPGWIMMTLTDRWQLAPGEEREQNVTVQLRTIRVQAVDAEGAPLANRGVTIAADGYHQPGALHTDAEGWVTISPAPLDAFHLRTDIEGEKTTLGPIDLPAGAVRGEVVVQAEK